MKRVRLVSCRFYMVSGHVRVDAGKNGKQVQMNYG